MSDELDFTEALSTLDDESNESTEDNQNDQSSTTDETNNDSGDNDNKPSDIDSDILDEEDENLDEDGNKPADNDDEDEDKDESSSDDTDFEDFDDVTQEFAKTLPKEQQAAFKEYIKANNEELTESIESKYHDYKKLQEANEASEKLFSPVSAIATAEANKEVKFVNGKTPGQYTEAEVSLQMKHDWEQKARRQAADPENLYNPQQGYQQGQQFYGDSLKSFIEEMYQSSVDRGGAGTELLFQLQNLISVPYKTVQDENGQQKTVVDQQLLDIKRTAMQNLLSEAKYKTESDRTLMSTLAEQNATQSTGNDANYDINTAKANVESDDAYGVWYKALTSNDANYNALMMECDLVDQNTNGSMKPEDCLKQAIINRLRASGKVPEDKIAKIQKGKASSTEKKPKQESKPKSTKTPTKQQKPKSTSTPKDPIEKTLKEFGLD